MSETFTLAACAEMLWRDKPMEWRLKRLTEMGFQVGIWNWPGHDLGMLEKSGAIFSSMTGYLRGRLADDEGAAELLATAGIDRGRQAPECRAAQSAWHRSWRWRPAGDALRDVTGAMWLKARDTLNRIADLAEKQDVTFMLENLNLAGRPSRRALRTRRRHAGARLPRQPAAACGSISISIMRRSARGT